MERDVELDEITQRTEYARRLYERVIPAIERLQGRPLSRSEIDLVWIAIRIGVEKEHADA